MIFLVFSWIMLAVLPLYCAGRIYKISSSYVEMMDVIRNSPMDSDRRMNSFLDLQVEYTESILSNTTCIVISLLLLFVLWKFGGSAGGSIKKNG